MATFQPATRAQIAQAYAGHRARLNRVSGGEAAVGAGVAAGAATAGGIGLASTGTLGGGAAMLAAGAGLAGAAAATGGAALAVVGVAIAVERLIKTHEEKLAAAAKNVTKYKLNYEKCKQDKLNKGKKVYPADKREGLFANNCHKDYKKWKKAERLLAEESKKVKDKLQKKGKLSKEMEADLELMQDAPSITSTYERMKDETRIMEQEMRKGRSEREARKRAQEELKDADYAGTGMGTVLLIGGVGVLAVGGLGVWAYRRRRAST